MRKLLIAAAATVPLALAALPVHAQVSITNGRTTPVTTSTAANGAPADVDVASGGSISGTGAAPALTVDSANSATLEGSITNTDTNGAIGVLLTGGHAGDFTSTGSITVNESFNASDSANGDSIVEAPLAQGTGRYGLRLTGAAPLVGAISLGGTGVTVKGNSSFGVSLEAPLQGALTVSGPISLVGDGGAAVQETAGVSGAVAVAGAITATGQGSRGLVLGGDVGGAVTLSSTVTATGYTSTTRAVDATNAKVQATPADVEQGGAAFTVAGNVAGGVFLAAPPVGTVAGSTADLDGDGVADGTQTAGSLLSLGSAPALLVGAAGKSITLGAFGTGENGYGLILRGAVTGSGLFDGVTANAVTLGAAGGQVSIAGGVRLVGAVASTAYEADSTALHVLSGVTAPVLRVEGALTSAIDDSTLTTAAASAASRAILIEAGANVGALVNTGRIASTGVGEALSAAAVTDRSGSLASVINEGVIGATVTPVTTGAVVTGSQVALDLRANITGVRLTQATNPDPDTVAGSTSGTTATTTTTVTATTPQIVGDVLLGSGPNTVNLLAGSIVGALDLGSGASTFTVDGGAAYTGALSYGGSGLALNVTNGVLTDTRPATLNLSNLNVGAAGVLVVAVDPASGTATSLQVAGPAVFAPGAKLGVDLLSLVTGSQTYTVVRSPQLSFSAGDAAISTSYLYDASLAADATAGTVDVVLRQRSAAELGLDKAEGQGLGPVLAGVQANAAIERAVLTPADKAGFLKVYDQLLPDHGGGVFLAAQQASEAIGRNTGTHVDLADPGAPAAWAEEFVLGVLQDKTDAQASRVGGFGFVGGASTAEGPLGVLGVTAAFVDADIRDPDLPSTAMSDFTEGEIGLYWTGEIGALRLSARGAGGYLFGSTRRSLTTAAATDDAALALASKGTWHGHTLSGRFTASYQVDLGPVFLRPQVAVDHFSLDQNAFTERGGGDGFDLRLASRDGSQTSATGGVVFGGRFGDEGLVWRPSLELGVRDVFSGSAGDTTAAFVTSAGAGDNFTLATNPITGVGEVAHLELKATGGLYEVSVAAQGQNFAHYREGDAGLTVRVRF